MKTETWKRIVHMGILFGVLVLLHVLAMHFLEQMRWGDALWVTLTTVTTVGYGDLSATTALGRTATVILLYVGGIFILARVVSDYFDFRLERRDLMIKGFWRWKMNDHLLLLNCPKNNTEQYLHRLLDEFQSNTALTGIPLQLLTYRFPEGLPEPLRQRGLLLYSGKPGNPADLQAVDVNKARHIIVLARDENDTESDVHTFNILHRLQEAKVEARIIVECVEDNNRQRFKKIGAHSVIRPMRAYPGMILQSLVSPGSENIFENFMSQKGDHYARYDFPLSGLTWMDVVQTLVAKGVGTPMAYVDHDGEVICNPLGTDTVDAQALFIMTRDQGSWGQAEIAGLFS
ncbi:MAG: potassium channel protein [Magnetococcales bacterium]|nr:potassium channel protein [Magnetococcales bacterium]